MDRRFFIFYRFIDSCFICFLVLANKKIDIILILFLISAFISLSQAKNFQLGFYQWLKLLEFVLFFFYVKYNFGNIFHFERIAQVFIVSGLFQSIIAIGQYSKQTSLGLWWVC